MPVVSRSAASAALILASCGGSSDDHGEPAASSQAICELPSWYSAPCWKPIEDGGVCEAYPDYEACSGPLDASNVVSFKQQVKFLWAGGSGSIQATNLSRTGPCSSGCSAGYFCGAWDMCWEDAFDPDRVSVLHGVVQRASSGSLVGVPGATVSVISDSRFGQVKTEWAHFSGGTPPSPTGRYFIAVNAGAPVRLRFEYPGYMPVERTVHPAAGQYVELDEVELLAEPTGELVDWSSSVWQVVAGATEGTGSSQRKLRIFIPSGTEWTPRIGHCETPQQACSTYSTEEACWQAGCTWSGSCTGTPNPCEQGSTDQQRCTMLGCTWDPGSALSIGGREYTVDTVGNNGPRKMPGLLPPASAYTYAVELRAKTETGISVSPTFDPPVLVYQENFLSFPVGWTVPSGYYDQAAGKWVQHRDANGNPINGQVVKIVSYTGTMADVDTNGDGVADNSGISDPERARLYTEYNPTLATLWRVPVLHFSSWDFNWGWGLPSTAAPPKPSIDKGGDGGDPCSGSAPEQKPIIDGSIIECDAQVLGEQIPIPGTPYFLAYRSNRVPGYTLANQLKVTLPNGTIPASATKATVLFSAAGKTWGPYEDTDLSGDQVFNLAWDGTDNFGRRVNGAVGAKVTVGLTYSGTYEATAQFGLPAGATSGSMKPTRQEATIWTEWNGVIGGLDASLMGLGGWTLNEHHAYSRQSNTVYYGWGGERRADALGDVIATANKDPAYVAAHGMAFGPDGVLYLAIPGGATPATEDGYIAKLTPDGTVTNLVGGTGSGLHSPVDVAVADNGVLYIADRDWHVVYRWDGTLTPVAGTPGTSGTGADGFGTDAGVTLDQPHAVELGPDGAVYIADKNNYKVRRLDPSGYLKVFAGSGTAGSGHTGDGGAATSARIMNPSGLVFRRDGSLCISDSDGLDSRIRCVDPTGIIRTVAGGGSQDIAVDGVLATEAKIKDPTALAVGLDGSLLIGEYSSVRVRRVAPNGRISTIAGTHGSSGCTLPDVPATAAKLQDVKGLAVDPSGRIYVADPQCSAGRIRRISPAILGQDAGAVGQIAVPSADGRELYVFDEFGKHLRTEDALTGKVRFEFTYADYEVSPGHSEPRLVSIRDKRGSTASGNDLVTEITRETSTGDAGSGTPGKPTAIVAPAGQTTTLTLPNGYLTGVTYPTSLGSYTLGYDSTTTGRLTQLTDPKGGSHSFEYETDGRLKKDRNPGTPEGQNPYRTLSRTEQVTNDVKTSTVTITTSQGLATQYKRVRKPDGSQQRQTIFPNASVVTSDIDSGGRFTVTLPDGTTRATTTVSDPRFGMAAASTEQTLTLVGTAPDNKKLTVKTDRTATGVSGTSFTTLTETRRIKKNPADGDTATTTLRYETKTDRVGTPPTVPPYIQEKSPVGRLVRRELDSYGRVVKIKLDYATPEVAAVDLAYDSSGRLTTVSQGSGAGNNRRTTFVYHATSGYLQYEKRGTAENDALFVTEYVTDDLGRVTQIFKNTTADGTQVKLGYDSNSNLTLIDIPTGPGSGDAGAVFQSHSMPHTSTNLLDLYNPPDAGVSPDEVDYGYDRDKRLTQIDWATSSKGLDFAYDLTKGHLDKIKRIGTATELASYVYDTTSSTPSRGKLTSITAGAITTSYFYTSTAQPNWGGLLFTARTDWSGSQKDVTYTYDDYLRVATEAVTGGQTVTYGYDNDSLITSAAVGSLGTLNLSSRSTQSGRLNSFSVGAANVTTSFTYHPTFGDLASLTTTCTGTTCTQSSNCGASGNCFIESLTPDSLGRISTRTETLQSAAQPQITYDYDTKSRLWKATPSGGTAVEYKYDETGSSATQNGNRTSVIVGSPPAVQSLTYDAQDRISTSGYSYDNDGRLTATPTLTSLGYDDFGSLTSVTLSGGVEIQYVYDALRRRVTRKKLVNSVVQSERRYLWSEEGRLLAVYDGLAEGAPLLEQYVYATGSHTPDAVVVSSTLYRIVQDHLGSVRLVVKASDGTRAQRVDYDAWGKIDTATQYGAGFQAFGYAGGLPDADTGLVQMGARWYDPVLGRWISKDPVRFDGGYNLYAYVENDPINRIDPSGLHGEALPAGTIDWGEVFDALKKLWPAIAGGAAQVGSRARFGWCGAGLLATGDAPHDRTEPYRTDDWIDHVEPNEDKQKCAAGCGWGYLSGMLTYEAYMKCVELCVNGDSPWPGPPN